MYGSVGFGGCAGEVVPKVMHDVPPALKMLVEGVAVEFGACEEGKGAGVGKVVEDESAECCLELGNSDKGFILIFLKDSIDYM